MTIYKNKRNNKYYCRFKIKNIQKHLLCQGARTESEAKSIEDAERLRVRQQLAGIIPEEKKKINFSTICKMYKEYAEINLKDKKHVKSKIKYFEEYFKKNTDISTITKHSIEKYKNHLINSGKAPATVNRYLGVLHKIFNIAIENELLDKNPCHSIKKLTEDNIQYNKYWTKEDEESFLKSAPEWLSDIVEFALLTGLRKTNIRLFEKSWINFKENILEIPKTKNKGNKYIKIPIGNKLLKIIQKHYNNHDKYLFVNPQKNKPYSDDTLSKYYKLTCQISNVKNIGFHGLRHTVGTRIAEKTGDLVVVKEILAHSSLLTTQRYLHVSEERKINAINLLENYKAE